jgi:hypothetical protein
MDQPAAMAPEPSTEQPPTSLAGQPAKGKKWILVAGLLALVAGSFLAIWIYNEATLQRPLDKVLASDGRNKNVTARAHYDGWVDWGAVVFDLSEVSGQSSSMDVFRVLLQFAQTQKEHRYTQVILAAYGVKKFVIPGDYFQQLGIEYGSQNPMYTVRTFSHHLSTMTGERPFPEYEGGILGVLGKEMDEFSQMNKQWYVNDYMARHR